MAKRHKERTGFRLLHGSFKGADGLAHVAPKWTCEFHDAHEKIRRITFFTSKSASEEGGRNAVRLVADVQAFGRATDPELMRWVSGLPERIRRRLAEWGLIEPDRAAAGKSIDDMLDLWHAALLARGTTEKQADQQRARSCKLIALCGYKRLADIQRGEVEALLAKVRGGEVAEESKISARTSNAWLQALGSFCRWAVRERFLGENPLAEAERVAVTDEQERDSLEPDEQARLVDAAQEGPDRFGMPGRDRAMLYKVALGTGLRASELAALVRSCFAVDGNAPSVTLAPINTKNRKGCTLPLEATLARELATYLANKLPAARVFGSLPRIDDLAEMFRGDLAAARTAWTNAKRLSRAERERRAKSDFLVDKRHNGKVLTFHSLRHSFIANGKRAGVPLATMMQLARHSDPKLTARRYGALALHDLTAAIAKMRIATVEKQAGRKAVGGNENSADAVADPNHLAQYLAQNAQRDQIQADSGGRGKRSTKNAKTPENAAIPVVLSIKKVQPPSGLEPETCGLQNRCSAN